jgi:hypothetical protein
MYDGYPYAACLLLVALLALAPLVLRAEDEPVKVIYNRNMKVVQRTASWGPLRGPDGAIEHGNTAVIPQQIIDVVFLDLQTWFAADETPETQRLMLQTLRNSFRGLGPAAGFRQQQLGDGTIAFSDPRELPSASFVGSESQGYQIGQWQPRRSNNVKQRGEGYQWDLWWIIQVQWKDEVRRYRIVVNLLGQVEKPRGGIRYQAIWTGPFDDSPQDFATVRAEVEAAR